MVNVNFSTSDGPLPLGWSIHKGTARFVALVRESGRYEVAEVPLDKIEVAPLNQPISEGQRAVEVALMRRITCDEAARRGFQAPS